MLQLFAMERLARQHLVCHGVVLEIQYSDAAAAECRLWSPQAHDSYPGEPCRDSVNTIGMQQHSS
jgi:hypothetical protein